MEFSYFNNKILFGKGTLTQNNSINDGINFVKYGKQMYAYLIIILTFKSKVLMIKLLK